MDKSTVGVNRCVAENAVSMIESRDLGLSSRRNARAQPHQHDPNADSRFRVRYEVDAPRYARGVEYGLVSDRSSTGLGW